MLMTIANLRKVLALADPTSEVHVCIREATDEGGDFRYHFEPVGHVRLWTDGETDGLLHAMIDVPGVWRKVERTK